MSKFTEGLYTKGYGIKSREMPTFEQLLEMQPVSDRAEIARNLGLSLRTLQRYEADNNAPRAVLLALYHESDYGKEQTHLKLFNEARAFAQLANSLQALQVKQSAVNRALVFRSGNASNSALFCPQLELFELPTNSAAA